MQFEWDSHKNSINKKKHGISFELACFAFEDPYILSIPDHRFDYCEERWQSLGRIKEILIYIAHTIGEDEDGEEIIRIISARKATPSETKKYQIYKENAKRTCFT